MLLKYGLIVFAYLLGSIPFSIILGKKLKGIDVREHGSGNPGGTNSMRWLGRTIGLLVMFLDGLKAGLIVILVHHNVFGDVDLLHPLAYGVAAAFGHVYSCYIKFKGGKAVAATVGLTIAFNPIMAFIMMTTFFASLRIWKYVSVSSTVAVATGLILGLVIGFTDTIITVRGVFEMGENRWMVALFYGILLLLVTFRHKSNFNNIKNGVEPKVKIFDKKK